MSENLPAEQAEPRKIQIAGAEVPLARIINRNDLKLALKRPSPFGFIPIVDGCIPDLRPMSEGGHIYPIAGNTVGFSASFHSMVMLAAGIQIVDSDSGAWDVNGQPGARAKVTATLPRAGEAPVQAVACVEMTYEDAYIAYGCSTDKKKAKERSFLPRKLETMATSRVIRKLTGFKVSANKSDLYVSTESGGSVPVIFAFRRDTMDMSQPDVRRAYIEQSARAHSRLYGNAQLEGSAEEERARLADEEPTADRVSPENHELGGMPPAADDDFEDADFEDEDLTEEPKPAEKKKLKEFRPGMDAADINAHDPSFSSDLQDCDDSKKGIYVVMKTLPDTVATLWAANWILAIGYDTRSDPHKIHQVWNDGKPKAAQRALTGLEYFHRKGMKN